MLIPRLNACVLKIRLSFLIAIVAAFVGFAISGVQSARAAAFNVTNTNDSGTGSLRQAILDANSTPGADTINFSVTGTILLESVLPNLADDVTISGPGANALTVQRDSAASAFRIFTINSGKTVTISGLTIMNGSAIGSFPN